MGKFKKGFFLGTLLGAAFAWMQTTPKGRETRDELLDHAAGIYHEIMTALKKTAAWKKMTEEGYLDVVKETVQRYAKKYAISPAMQESLVATIGQQWTSVKNQLAKLQEKKEMGE